MITQTEWYRSDSDLIVKINDMEKQRWAVRKILAVHNDTAYIVVFEREP